MALHPVEDGSGFVMGYDIVRGVVPEDVLLIHGNLASNRWWSPAVEVWKTKAAGRELPGSLIMAEFRGCGASSAPRSGDEVDMHLFARDYLSLVKALGFQKLNLIGHSTGGLIAALIMAMEPALVRRAVLLDPVGARGIKFEPGMIGAFEKMKTDRDLVALVMNSTILGNDASAEFFQKVVVEDAFAAVKTVGHLVLQALDGLDVRQELSAVTAPTLVLHGEQDSILPLEESRQLAQILRNGSFESVPGWGHCANVESPKAFVDRVDRFFAKTSTSSDTSH